MNNSYDSGVRLGQYVWLALLVFLILYFLYRTSHSESRSLRFANLALCCGFAGWLLSTGGAVLWILGAVSGLSGVVLAVLALKARRDGGAGLVRVILALVLSAFAVLGSVSYYLIPAFIEGNWVRLEEPDASAWIYRSKEHGFQMSLPSSRWRAISTSDGKPGFRHPSRAQIFFDAVAGRSAEEHEERRANDASMAGTAKGAAVKRQEGVNAKGCRYESLTAMKRYERDEPIFVVTSMIWCPDKQAPTGTPTGASISLVFEGKPGKLASPALLERNAKFILDSVEDGD